MVAFFDGLVSFLKFLATWLLDGAIYVIKISFFIMFDGFLTCIYSIFAAIDFSAFLIDAALKWSSLPPMLQWIVHAAGLPEGISIIVMAIGLRMAINLVPAEFTRL